MSSLSPLCIPITKAAKIGHLSEIADHLAVTISLNDEATVETTTVDGVSGLVVVIDDDVRMAMVRRTT